MSINILTASHVELKKKILDDGIKKHQTVIDDFRRSIKDMLSSETVVNEEEIDLSQQEFNTALVQNSNSIAEQLTFANEEMKILYDMAPTIGNIHNTVQLGSVVVTDKDIFFVSVSIERFKVDGLTIFGLSTQAPIYQAMEGKKKGESFSFKDEVYNIVDLF
ncbi:hypothetical protein [Chryseolinea sp. H1M3-3]|uniref:hypothetical protein n=1 Tax=Chryseolinea sp. H1M3-3 TaxID=3034144 RepID=UPI0023ED76EA|nr:hypothetical protein [Chryseolinea sp. H1M3-3]